MGTTSYFILPHDPKTWVTLEDNDEKFKSDLLINFDDFAQKLITAWPKANFEKSSNSKTIEWSIPQSSPDVSLSYPYDPCYGSIIYGSIVSLDACLSDLVLEFALWYRRYVPFRHRLFIMIPSGENIELTKDTTAQDIRRALWIGPQ